MSSSRILSFPLSQSDLHEIGNRKRHLIGVMKRVAVTDIYIRDIKAIHYLTGLLLSTGALLLSVNGSMSLFVDGRYVGVAYKNFSLEPEICSIVVLQDKSGEKECIDLLKRQNIGVQGKRKVAFDSELLSYEQARDLLSTVEKEGFIECESHISLFREMRRQKSQLEIDAIKKACELCEEGFHLILRSLESGVSERELAQKLIIYWYQNGADGVSFEPIIAFGSNSAYPHWRASESRLQAGDIVLVDIGVSLRGYHSDMTRTFTFGDPTEKEFDDWFKATLEAYEFAKQHSFEGVSPQDVDKAARDVLATYGYKDRFTHGLGHGLGLEVHEAPRLSPRKGTYSQSALMGGDVITIEPGIYFEDRGGVRLENTCYVDGSKTIPLINTPFFPRWHDYMRE